MVKLSWFLFLTVRGKDFIFILYPIFLKPHDYIKQIFFCFNLRSAQQTFPKPDICLIEQFVFPFFHNYILSV